MFLILRLIRLLLPVFKDYFEDKREDREAARRNGGRKPMVEMQESTGDPLADTMAFYRRGDYRGAYEHASGLAAVNGTAEADFFRGAMLLAEGRLDDSETLLRQYLANTKDPAGQASANALLGELLIERGKYDEAAGCLHTGMTLAPDQSAALRQLAIVTLRKGEEPELAVAFAQEAVKKEHQSAQVRAQKAKLAEEREKAAEIAREAEAIRVAAEKKKFPWQKGGNTGQGPAVAIEEPLEAPPTPSSEFRQFNMAENLAAMAWAVAASTQNEGEVDRLVEEALPLASGKGVATRAEVHFHAACAYAEIGVSVKSTKHFTQAATADPHGRWGKSAKNMLMASSKR
jgi:tetratricopeptide (TPR) repeat protein